MRNTRLNLAKLNRYALKKLMVLCGKATGLYALRFSKECMVPGFCLQGDTVRFVVKVKYSGFMLTSVYLRCVLYSPYNFGVVFDSDRDLPLNERTHQLRRKDIKPNEMFEVIVTWKVPDDSACGVYYTVFELWSPSKVTSPSSWLYPPVLLARSEQYGRPEVVAPIRKRVFVSYDRNDKDHCKWVLEFADMLRRFGIQVMLDENPDYLMPGDRLREEVLLERESSDFIIPICSKWYVEKADSPEVDEYRKSGVRIETEAFSEPAFLLRSQEKFIPVVRNNGDSKGIEKLPRYLRELGLIIYQDMDREDWQGEALTNVIRKIRGKS